MEMKFYDSLNESLNNICDNKIDVICVIFTIIKFPKVINSRKEFMESHKKMAAKGKLLIIHQIKTEWIPQHFLVKLGRKRPKDKTKHFYLLGSRKKILLIPH